MADASQIDHGIDESWLLRSTVHLVGVRNLHRAIVTVVFRYELGAFRSLIAIGWREAF